MGFHPAEIEVLEKLGGERVLEVGSGKGYTAAQMAELFPLSVGVEPDLEALFDPKAQENYSADNFLVCGACGDGLPFPDNTFDGAVSHWAVHHYRFPIQVLAEIYRVLKFGGWLYLADGVRMPPEQMTTKQNGHRLFHVAAVAVDMHNGINHFPFYDADTLGELVMRAGFEIENVSIITEENPEDEDLEPEYVASYMETLERLRTLAGGRDDLERKIDAAAEHIKNFGIRMHPFAMVIARKRKE